MWIESILKKAPEPLPLALSALLGDAIQNLRAALDYCAWAAAGDEIRRTQPCDVSFPLYEDAAKFATWRIKKETWYGQPTLDAIDRAQPFHAPTDALHPLLVLQHLSNVDKHRLLNVVQYAAIDLGTIAIEPEPTLKNYTGTSGLVKAGDVIARVEFPRPMKSGELMLRPSFGWYESVAYERDGETRHLRIDEMMNGVCKFVADTAIAMSVARRIERGEVDANEAGWPGAERRNA